MTLCIGALALDPSPVAPCIVLCFDYMGANEYWGADGEYKFYTLSNQLVAVVAGAVAQAKELAWIYQGYLASNRLSPDKNEAVEQLRKPLSELKERRAASYVRQKLAISYADFLKGGRKWLGRADWQRYLGAIEKHQPNVQMIIAGFLGGDALLCEIDKDDDGRVELRLGTNFCLIGSGTFAAEPILFARQHSFNTLLSRALCNVYEAKRTGELNPHVGPKTRIYIVRPPKPGETLIWTQFITDEGQEWLQEQYAEYGPQKMPDAMLIPPGAIQDTRPITS